MTHSTKVSFGIVEGHTKPYFITVPIFKEFKTERALKAELQQVINKEIKSWKD